MSRTDSKKPGLGPLSAPRRRRRVVSADRSDLVESRPLATASPLPLLATPAVEGVDLVAWVGDQRDRVRSWLADHGGVLFRGFGLTEPEQLEALVKALAGELLEYTYRSTPRSQVQGEVYTSTEYPADRSIPMHNEMSYSREWPRTIFFLCADAADEGGETPIADSHGVLRRVPDEVQQRFRTHGVMYVRNYGGGLDLPWQEVFGTDDRQRVESFCVAQDIGFEWLGDDRLRTRQVCQATVRHPDSGEELWFNQAHLFHVSSLPEPVRRGLLAEVAPEDLPRNAFFGDGSPISGDDLEAVRSAYGQEEVTFPWQTGDLLVLDNMRVAHGRRPYSGQRKVLVGMADGHRAGSGQREAS